MATNNKNRKSEAQDRFDEADNAGRFADDDRDAQLAKEQALRQGASDTTGYDSSPVENETGSRGQEGDEGTNASARRGDAQVQDFTGDAQNVNDGGGRPMSDEEARQARNKANEGKGEENTQ